MQNPDQQAEASRNLMEFYQNPASAEFLCRVIHDHQDLRFRQLAALGLRETTKLLEDNSIKFELFVRLIGYIKDADSILIPALLEPAVFCYVDNPGWTVLSSFVDEISKTNLPRVIEVLHAFLSVIPNGKTCERVGVFVKVIDMALNDTSLTSYVRSLLDFNLSLVARLGADEDLAMRVVQEFRAPFSMLLAKCIESGNSSLIREVVGAVWNSIDFDCYGLDLQLFFPQIVSFLADDKHDIETRVIVTNFLGDVMLVDANSVPEDVLMGLVMTTLDLSAQSIQQQVVLDDNNPIASLLDETLAHFFTRIQKKTLESCANELVEKTLSVCPYTGVLLIDALLQRSEELMQPKVVEIFTILFKGLKDGPPYLQELCCLVMWSHAHLFTGLFEADGYAGLVELLKLKPLDDQKLRLITAVVQGIGNPHEAVDIIVAFCMHLLSMNDATMSAQAFLILSIVLTSGCAEAAKHIECIYEHALRYANSEDDSLQNTALLLLGVIMKYYSEIASPKLDQVYRIFLDLCKSEDIVVRRNGLCHFPKVFSGFPKQMEPIAQLLVKPLLEYISKPYDAEYTAIVERRDLHGEREFRLTVVAMWEYGYIFVRCLLSLYPALFLTDRDVLLGLFLSIFRGLNSMFSSIIRESAILLRLLTKQMPIEMFGQFIEQFHKFWDKLLDLVAREKEESLVTECAKAMLGFLRQTECKIISGRESEFLELCFVKIESQKSFHTGEYIFLKDYHGSFGMLIEEVLIWAKDVTQLMRPFIDRLLQLYQSDNDGMKCLAISLISAVYQKVPQLLGDDVTEQLLKSCIEQMMADDVEIAVTHIGLLIVLIGQFSDKMRPLAIDLVGMAQSRAVAVIRSGNTDVSLRRLVECLVAFISALDELSEQPIVGVDTLKWSLRFVPYQIEPCHNIHPYKMIHRRLDALLQTEAKDVVIGAIFRLFTIPKEDLIFGRLLPARLLLSLDQIGLSLFNELGDSVRSFFDTPEAMELCLSTMQAVHN